MDQPIRELPFRGGEGVRRLDTFSNCRGPTTLQTGRNAHTQSTRSSNWGGFNGGVGQSSGGKGGRWSGMKAIGVCWRCGAFDSEQDSVWEWDGGGCVGDRGEGGSVDKGLRREGGGMGRTSNLNDGRWPVCKQVCLRQGWAWGRSGGRLRIWVCFLRISERDKGLHVVWKKGVHERENSRGGKRGCVHAGK
jgi:hypothetical protein